MSEVLSFAALLTKYTLRLIGEQRVLCVLYSLAQSILMSAHSCINMWAETALISLINSTVWHPVFAGNSLSSLDVREKVLTFYYLYSTFSSCLKLFM